MNIGKILSVRSAAVPVLAVAAIFAQPAQAQTASTNLSVGAQVTDNCTVSSTSIDFGDVDATAGAAVLATGGLSVVCTNGTQWAASADAGAGASATMAVRQMTSGGNTLNYALYTDLGRTTIWGDGNASTATIDDTGTGVTQAKTIYGRILAGQTGAPSGVYADTVVVTVTY